MDEKIEKMMELSGNFNKYQFILLGITFILWSNVDMIAVTLPLLERVPEVRICDETGACYETQMNYTICEQWKKDSYTISKRFAYSLVDELEIYCDKVRTGMIGTCIFFGFFLGAFSFQFLADFFGRKKTILFGIGGFALALGGMMISTYYTLIVIFACLSEISTSLICLGSLMLTTEVAATRIRSMFGAIIMSGFSFCAVVYILVMKSVESWRIPFAICISLTLFSGGILMLCAYESPRYFISINSHTQFLSILRKIAEVNHRSESFNKEISDDTSEYSNIMKEIHEKEPKKLHDKQDTLLNTEKETTKNERINRTKTSILSLLTYSSVRYKFLILCYLWFCISGNYYGLQLSLKNLPGDIYLNGIIIYIFEAVCYFLSGYLINIHFIGRKGTTLSYYLIAMISFSILAFIEVQDIWKIVITFIGRFAVAGIFYILYSFSLEIYPTVIRAKGLGVNSALARVSSLVIPLIVEVFSVKVNYIIYAFMNISCGFLLLFLPETVGKPLIEHLE